MNPILYPIGIPFIAGLLIFMMPRKAHGTPAAFSFAVSALTFLFTIYLFLNKPLRWTVSEVQLFRVDTLASFVALFIGLFGVLIVMYSAGYMREYPDTRKYYGLVLWTIGSSIGAAVSNNIVLFLVFWGFLGVTLYLLIGCGNEDAKNAAKKTLIIVGGSDALMLFGLGLAWSISNSLEMSAMRIDLTSNGSAAALVAFVSLALGAFAKAGAMPLHTWIPASSEVAPAPVMALLPASIDKLLGIYFLARISLEMFVVKEGSCLSLFLLTVGAVTILAAVMMALIQHNFKRLLSYHAVSQVGYMILGIGTANPIGIAGGLFHMLNHAIYKSCLFLSGGAIEKQAHTTELDELGGLAGAMPLTFFSCLVAALSISGVPPFNGFISKWMIYQGVIEIGKHGGRLWIVWLIAAIFGSALTLASFMKLIHAAFLGQPARRSAASAAIREVGAAMWIPMVILASLCVIFGVFAYGLPLKYFIFPSVASGITLTGVWDPSLATLLILVGIVCGLILYAMGTRGKKREVEPFVGGVDLASYPDMRVSGVSFYNTIKEIRFLKATYTIAEKGGFDIYEVGRRVTFFFSGIFQYLHNGILPTYLTWCLLGALMLFFLLKG